MNQGRLIGLLLSPSAFSISFSMLLSGSILGVATWSYITPDNPLYDYLFGRYGLTTILQNSSNALSAINGVFSNPAAYNIAVLVFALFVGLLVYVLLQGADHIANKAKVGVNEVVYVSDSSTKQSMRKEAEVKAGLRFIAFFVWVAYLIFFARVIVPYCILLGRLDLAHFWTWSNIWHGLSAFLLLMLSFHLHTVFLRLMVLRPRLFGSTDVLVENDDR